MSNDLEYHRPYFEAMGWLPAAEQPITGGKQEDDYDYEGAKKAGVKPDPQTGHMPDTFKKPNHITFSDESQYHGKEGNEGGHWNKLSDDRWSFTPGKTNLENHSMKEMREYFKKYEPGNVLGVDHVDTEHHVPLLASALLDDQGNHYGYAFDHRFKDSDLGMKGFSVHNSIKKHEAEEVDHMKDLIKIGYKPQEAYEKAHALVTTREHDKVEALGGKEFLEKYKQYNRDGAAEAAKPSDRGRHPDAHTSRFALDDPSINSTWQSFGDIRKDIGSEAPKDIDYSKMRKSTNVEDVRGQTEEQRHFEFIKEYKEFLTPREQEVVDKVIKEMKELKNPTEEEKKAMHNWLANVYNNIQAKTFKRDRIIDNPPLPTSRPKH